MYIMGDDNAWSGRRFGVSKYSLLRQVEEPGITCLYGLIGGLENVDYTGEQLQRLPFIGTTKQADDIQATLFVMRY